LLISIVVIIVLVGLNYQATVSTVTDSCRTLLALNGTLLALVMGFSAFYFIVIDARRIEAARSVDKDASTSVKVAKELQGGILVPWYREQMKAVSTFLTSIAFTYGFFLIVTFVVYMFNLPQQLGTAQIAQPTLLGFEFAIASPIVTISDIVLMTWYLTRDVAGRFK